MKTILTHREESVRYDLIRIDVDEYEFVEYFDFKNSATNKHEWVVLNRESFTCYVEAKRKFFDVVIQHYNNIKECLYI